MFKGKESEVDATTVAVDLAKSVFQLAEADDQWRIVATHRLTRRQFERFFANRQVRMVIMEACGSAHHWARWLAGLGIRAVLLPPRHVRPYVLGNKTDAADCAALLQAARNLQIRPVRVKSLEQQSLQAMHRMRSQWMATRTQRINALRGFCREFGLTVPRGAHTGLRLLTELVADDANAIPAMLRIQLPSLLEEIRVLESRVALLERDLAQIARRIPACQLLMTIPGVGLLTSTALVAAVGTDISQFHNARQFANWFGITPTEHSSGQVRRLGRISKAGPRYLRMLLTHGARSVLQAAARARSRGRDSQGLQRWALSLAERTHHNKATCAVANKLARICFATLRAQQPFDARRACAN
jgi:transposase